MKHLTFLSIILAVLIAACQSKPQPQVAEVTNPLPLKFGDPFLLLA